MWFLFLLTILVFNDVYSNKPRIKVNQVEQEYLLPASKESTNCIKKYSFVEQHDGSYKNGFTEIRKLGNARYTIRHDMNKNYHVTNIEDMEVYVKNFLKLNGYT